MASDGSDLSRICLFVGNLPYSVTNSELEDVFKSYGPLRSCYIVKQKGATDTIKKSRGFGYVTYMNREDAQKAKLRVKVVGSRPVQVCFARRKCVGKPGGKPSAIPTQGEASGVVGRDGDEDEEVCEEEEEEEEDDYEALTARKKLTTKQRRAKAKSERSCPKFDVGKIAVFRGLPVDTKEKRLLKKCEKFGEVEEVIFPLESDPQGAHVFFSAHKAAHLAVTGLNGTRYKKSSEGVMTVELLSHQNKKVSVKTLKKSRLIVRNLSFKCSEEDIQEVFQEFGAVLRVDIPKKENGYMRGYAFIQFGSYFDASKALSGVNGTEIKGRKVTVDWLLPKTEYQKKPVSSQERGVASVEGVGGAVEEEDSDDDERGDDGERGLSEDSDAEEEEGIGEEEGEEEEEEGEGENEEDEGDSDRDSIEEDRVKALSKPSQKIAGANQVSEDVSEGRTVFIRNLPFDANQAALKRRLARYGVVRYCRVMMNKETGLATGSAFVQFKTDAAARRCLEAAGEETESGVQLEGQRLKISLALSRGEMERVRRERSNRQEKEDKRNLYLAKEGAIFPESEAAQGLSKTDMTKRMKAYAEKKAKLANPNYYVSKTRLCVRNLPTSVDERKVRALFQQATSSPDAKIVQVKILRSTERVDSKGMGRSMGYGFIEFSAHDAALSALRATNNNPAIFGKAKRPIVDFAVEDSRVMKIREKRELLRQQRITAAAASDAAGEGCPSGAESAGNKRLTKRRKWQLKWQARRQKRKAADHSLQEKEPDTGMSGKERVNGRSGRVGEYTKRRDMKSEKRTEKPSKARPGGQVKHSPPDGRQQKRKAEMTGRQLRPHKFSRNKDGNRLEAFSKQRRRQKRTPKRADMEEREFTNMVAKYKKKFGKQ